MRLRTTAKNRIHAVLADAGLDRAEGALWTGPRWAWLAAAELNPVARLIVEDYLALIDSLGGPIAAVEAQIAARAKPDPTVRNSDRKVRHGHITKQGSEATTVRAWTVRNCFQVGPARRGAGSRPARCRR